jgi:hypothetical protein
MSMEGRPWEVLYPGPAVRSLVRTATAAAEGEEREGEGR